MSKGPNKKHYHAQRQRQGACRLPVGWRYLGTAQLYRELAWAIVTREARTAAGWYRVVECYGLEHRYEDRLWSSPASQPCVSCCAGVRRLGRLCGTAQWTTWWGS